ncbi:DUF6033 family protein [Lachnospiraceae bacterium 38-14]
MAVKVGNSWVTETAYAYAKSKVDENTSSENKKGNSMLDKLSEKYPDIKFSTSTQPFSGTGKNNIGIAPNILREMENDPEKRLEYEALIYDCSQVIKNLPDKMPNGSRLKSFGFIINSDCSLKGWVYPKAGKIQNIIDILWTRTKRTVGLILFWRKRKRKKLRKRKSL